MARFYVSPDGTIRETDALPRPRFHPKMTPRKDDPASNPMLTFDDSDLTATAICDNCGGQGCEYCEGQGFLEE